MTKEEAIKAIKSHCYFANLVPAGKEALDMAIKALEQEPNTWSLDDAREDFMHDVYNTLDFLPTNNEANRIIDSFDRVTKCIEQESCGDAVSRKDIYFKLTNGAYPNETIEQFIDRLVKELKALQPVTPKPKTGHWKLVQRGKSIDVCCSNCKAVRIKGYAYGYTIDQLDKEYVKESFESDDMRYCPYCGSGNRGRTIVKES